MSNNTHQWSVVEYDDETIQIVPKCWIIIDDDGNIACYWPPFNFFSSNKHYISAVKKNMEPKPEWIKYGATILGTYDDFDKAMKKLKKAEDRDVPLTTVIEKDKVNRKLRHKRAYTSSDDSTEEKCTSIIKKIKPIPKPSTDHQMYIQASSSALKSKKYRFLVDKDETQAPKSTDSSVDLNHSNNNSVRKKLKLFTDESAGIIIKPRKIYVVNSSDEEVVSTLYHNKATTSEIQKPKEKTLFNASQLTNKQLVKSRKFYVVNSSDEEVVSTLYHNKATTSEIQKPKEKTLFNASQHTNKQLVKSRKIYVINSSDEEVESTLYHNKATTSGIQKPKEKTLFNASQHTNKQLVKSRKIYVVNSSDEEGSPINHSKYQCLDDHNNYSEILTNREFQEKVLKNLALIKLKLTQLDEKISNVSLSQPDDIEGIEDIFEEFPLSEEIDLVHLEEKLEKDMTYKKKLFTAICKINGVKTYDITKLILRKLFTDKFAVSYNWTGTKGKKPLASLFLSKIIIDAVCKNAKGSKESNVIASIKNWFRLAESRYNYKYKH